MKQPRNQHQFQLQLPHRTHTQRPPQRQEHRHTHEPRTLQGWPHTLGNSSHQSHSLHHHRHLHARKTNALTEMTAWISDSGRLGSPVTVIPAGY